ncbi:hypothetical protein KR026_005660, partial [Drosophila bipectinata]
ISENNAEESTKPSSSSQRVPSKASSNILVLDNDCLEIIFSLLSLKDQLNFSRSNRKIERIYRNYAQRKYKHITKDITNSLEESDLEYIVEQVNENLISYESPIAYIPPLDPSPRDKEELRLLRMHCPMLRRLKMTFSGPHWEDLIQLKNLHTLDAFLEFSSNDDYEKFFLNLSKNLPCLRKLVLEAPFYYNGKGLHVLEKLQHLEIYDFCNLDAKYIIDCCIKMKNLHFLKIGMWPENLSNENFSAIVANCRNLETFGFTDNELLDNVAYEKVCELPRLKHLTITHPRRRPGFIKGLVRRTGTPLESLILFGSNLCKEQIGHICDIPSLRELWLGSTDDNFNVEGFTKLKSLEYLHLDMEGITIKQLLELVLGWPRLRVLNVLYCWNVTSDFIS